MSGKEGSVKKLRDDVRSKPKTVISVQIPTSLYEKVLELAKMLDYASLSEFVRELLRREVAKYESSKLHN